MIRVVSWNIAKREAPWNALEEMGRGGEADVALLHEAGNPPPRSGASGSIRERRILEAPAARRPPDL